MTLTAAYRDALPYMYSWLPSLGSAGCDAPVACRQHGPIAHVSFRPNARATRHVFRKQPACRVVTAAVAVWLCGCVAVWLDAPIPASGGTPLFSDSPCGRPSAAQRQKQRTGEPWSACHGTRQGSPRGGSAAAHLGRGGVSRACFDRFPVEGTEVGAGNLRASGSSGTESAMRQSTTHTHTHTHTHNTHTPHTGPDRERRQQPTSF